MLNFKKTPRIIIVAAVALAVVLSIGFAVSGDVWQVMSGHSLEKSATYAPREWLNYYNNDKLPWGDSFDLELPDYPDIIFRWTPEKVTAIVHGGEKELFSGMPVWNVYLADLTGDGLPEFCATISIGSGIVDTRVAAYDYMDDKLYQLSNRGCFDYALSLEGGQLIVDKTQHGSGAKMVRGEPAIVKGELIIAGTTETDTIQLTTAQLTHDDSTQDIVLDTSRVDDEQRYILRVVDVNGKILWETNAGLPHAGWNSLFLTRVNGKDYLMQYNPTTYQGASTYNFHVFSLDENGTEIIMDKDEVSFSQNPPGGTNYFHKRDIEPVKAFFEHVNRYLTVSELLLNTDDHITNLLQEDQHNRAYGTPSEPIIGLQDYFFGSADLTIDEQMAKFIQDYTSQYGELKD